MITFKLPTLEIDDIEFILGKQDEHSWAYHYCYKTYDESCDDSYEERIKSRFGLNDIECRSVMSDVKSDREKELTQKENKQKRIEELEQELEKVSNKGKVFRITQKIAFLKQSIENNVVWGSRKLLQSITRESNKKGDERDEDKIAELKNQFRERHQRCVYIMGEANQGGNRFFDFSRILEGILIYKPFAGKRVVFKLVLNKRQKQLFEQIWYLVSICGIALSVRFDTNFVRISYDETVLNGFALDKKSRTKEVKEIKSRGYGEDLQKAEIKKCYKKYYDEQRERMLVGKIEGRCMSVDLNPTNVGITVLEKINDEGKYKVLHAEVLSYDELCVKLGVKSYDELQIHQNNKRHYETSILWKYVFKLAVHYKCASFVMEDLDFKASKKQMKEDFYKEFNRKVNNIWNRTFQQHLITKYTNSLGIELIKVEPCYSSFVGNVQHAFGDAAAAACEIGRRGLFKYIKGGKFYPIISTEDVSTLAEMFNDVEHFGDVLRSTSVTWVKIYKFLQKSLGDKDFQHRFRTANVLKPKR